MCLLFLVKRVALTLTLAQEPSLYLSGDLSAFTNTTDHRGSGIVVSRNRRRNY